MSENPSNHQLDEALRAWQAIWAASIQTKWPGVMGRFHSRLQRFLNAGKLHAAQEGFYLAARQRLITLEADIAGMHSAYEHLKGEHDGLLARTRKLSWIVALQQLAIEAGSIAELGPGVSDSVAVVTRLQALQPGLGLLRCIDFSVVASGKARRILSDLDFPGVLAGDQIVGNAPVGAYYRLELDRERGIDPEWAETVRGLKPGSCAVLITSSSDDLQGELPDLPCTGDMRVEAPSGRFLRVIMWECPMVQEVAMQAGFPLLVNLGDPGPISWYIQQAQLYEEAETQWLRARLKPGATFVDVGANIGYYAMMACRAVGPQGRVVAIEPDPINAAILRMNAARAPHPEAIRIVRSAVGAGVGSATLYRSNSNFGDHRLFQTKPDAQATSGTGPRIGLEVPVQPLDAILANEPRVDVVKSDTQGYEIAVVAGLQRTIDRFHPLLMLEYWPFGLRQAGYDPRELPQMLQSHGYSLFKLATALEPYSADPEEPLPTSEDDFFTLVAAFQPDAGHGLIG
jgi:FkbM family methyltransferase